MKLTNIKGGKTMLRFNKKAQNTLEYAVLIAVVAGGLIAMQTYMKRAFQGSLQSSADDAGEQFSMDGLQQMNYTFYSNSSTNEKFFKGVTSSNLTKSDISTRTFEVTLDSLDNETFDAH